MSSVLLQWATGGLLFGWVTTRRRDVGIGYGWLLRITYGLMAIGAFVAGRVGEEVLLQDIASLGVAAAASHRPARLGRPAQGGRGRRAVPPGAQGGPWPP